MKWWWWWQLQTKSFKLFVFGFFFHAKVCVYFWNCCFAICSDLLDDLYDTVFFICLFIYVFILLSFLIDQFGLFNHYNANWIDTGWHFRNKMLVLYVIVGLWTPDKCQGRCLNTCLTTKSHSDVWCSILLLKTTLNGYWSLYPSDQDPGGLALVNHLYNLQQDVTRNLSTLGLTRRVLGYDCWDSLH